MYSALKDDGYLFLGIPVGKDELWWNVHRVYGERRLKLLFSDKFEEIEWIGEDRSFLLTCQPQKKDCIQPVIVLKKYRIAK